MSIVMKDQAAILSKLGIEKLNPMQEDALKAIKPTSNVVLLSPTGTGKTLAFLLPILSLLDRNISEVQALILVPSRELAIQIESVLRHMGTGYKTNAIYGGRPVSKDKIDLKHAPSILIGTPGRIADHIRRSTFSIQSIKTLVLDEFDKSLEIGFESDMNEIIDALTYVESKVLTSATNEVEIPSFVGLKDPMHINYLKEKISQLKINIVVSPSKDKLETLVEIVRSMGNQPGIVFCNFKESIQRVSDFLVQCNIDHGCFYGGMEQRDRERALIKFRNGTHQLIIATDLAARGIDVPEIKFIVHYHLPIKSQEFVHRNGRTARMNKEGTAYIIKWEQEILPDFIQSLNPDSLRVDELSKIPTLQTTKWKTLFISGGRKDKISKGDIAGLCFKQGRLDKDEIGAIELKQDCAFIAVRASKAQELVKSINNYKLKKKKVRVTIV